MVNEKKARFAGACLMALGLVGVACGDDFTTDASGDSANSGGSKNQAGADNGGGGEGGDGGASNSGGKSNAGGSTSPGSTNTGGASSSGGSQNTGGSSAAILLDEDFSANTGSWSFIDPEPSQGKTASSAASKWTYEHVGYLTQLTNYAGCPTGSEPACAAGTIEPGLAIALEPGSESWTDYAITASFVAFDDDVVGVVARFEDEDNYLLFEAALQGNYVRIRVIDDGVWKTLSEDLTPDANYVQSIDIAVPNELKLVVVGNQYTGFANGVKVLTAEAGTSDVPEKGGVGVATLSSENVRFDRVKVVAVE